jgi:hypothetical protein
MSVLTVVWVSIATDIGVSLLIVLPIQFYLTSRHERRHHPELPSHRISAPVNHRADRKWRERWH